MGYHPWGHKESDTTERLTPSHFSYCCCSVAKSCPTLCNPMDCSTPDFPVLHYLPNVAQCIFTGGFPCGSAGKESACNVRDLGTIPGLGRSPGEGNSYPLQYFGLENSMDSIIHGVRKSWTQLSDFHLSSLSQWCFLTISSSAAPFFCLHYFPESQSFPMSWHFVSDGKSIRTSTLVLPMNIHG